MRQNAVDFESELQANLRQAQARLARLQPSAQPVTALRITLWSRGGRPTPGWVKEVYEALDPKRSALKKWFRPPHKFLEASVLSLYKRLEAQGLRPQLEQWDDTRLTMHGTETDAYGFQLVITPQR